MATVEQAGCAQGRLRVGYVAEEAATQGALSFIQRGPVERSNVFRGVDLDPAANDQTACSGYSNRDQRRGATHPAVAIAASPRAPDAPRTAGVVAWLGDGIDCPACGGDPVSLQVLGVWLEAAKTDLYAPVGQCRRQRGADRACADHPRLRTGSGRARREIVPGGGPGSQ